MTTQEIKTAIKLLDGRTDRTEIIGTGGNGMALTAYWLDGGQRLFYTLDEVREHIEAVAARS